MQSSSRVFPDIDPSKTTGITTIPFPASPGGTPPRICHILPNSLRSVFGEIVRRGYDTLLYTMDNAREIETAETLLHLKRALPIRMILLSAHPRQAIDRWLYEKDSLQPERYTQILLESDAHIILSGQHTGDAAPLYREFISQNCTLVIRP